MGCNFGRLERIPKPKLGCSYDHFNEMVARLSEAETS